MGDYLRGLNRGVRRRAGLPTGILGDATIAHASGILFWVEGV